MDASSMLISWLWLVFTIIFDDLPLKFVNVQCVELGVLLTTCITATEQEHSFTVHHRGMVGQSARSLSFGVFEPPRTVSILVFWLPIQIIE